MKGELTMRTQMPKKELLKILFIVPFLMIVCLSGRSFSAETYPDRPITLVVPWGVGGTTDLIARSISPSAEKEFGQPIIILNKGGAAGVVGLNYALKSKPDGYTLVLTTTSSYLLVPHMRAVPYNPLTDITDIAPIVQFDFGLCVRSDSAWKSYEDVIKYARDNPGKFTYATAGIGNTQHIFLERIAKKEGIKWTQIPFKSGAEAVTACLGGHADAVSQGSLAMLPHVNAGKLRFLISLNNYRWGALPNVPTIVEKGSDSYAWSYMTVLGPKGIPEPIREKIEDVFNKAKKSPSFVKVLNQYKIEAINNMSGKEHGLFWRSKYDEMGKMLKDAGLAAK
jgi:tripartite-type tricarboxylate transporter receptor subunit TctC